MQAPTAGLSQAAALISLVREKGCVLEKLNPKPLVGSLLKDFVDLQINPSFSSVVHNPGLGM